MQQIKNQTSTSVLLSQFDYAYDTEGQLQTWTKNYPSLPTPQRYDLGYDNADQLLTAPLRKTTNNALIRQYTYGYDLASNRTSELVGSTTTNSVPNNVNEITSQSGGNNRTLSYDLNGSLTSDGGNRSFEWDGANRLVAVNYPGTTQRTEFSYDGLNRCVKLVEKNGSTIVSTRRFVYCGTEKCEYRNANGAVQLQLFAQGQSQSSVAYFYFRDHLGSIREMTDTSGAVVARYDYDPWGRSNTVIGTNKPDFNFTGLYQHAKSGLDMATYRFYDPDLGRWLNRDPSGESGGLNLYRYGGNSPGTQTDMAGLCPDDWWDLTLSLGLNGTIFYPDGFTNTVHTAEWGFYQQPRTGEFGWFETFGSGPGLDTGGILVGSVIFGDVSVFSSPFLNDNGAVPPLAASVHRNSDTGAFQGISLGFGPQAPPLPNGSATRSTTVVHPIGRVILPLMNPIFLPPGM